MLIVEIRLIILIRISRDDADFFGFGKIAGLNGRETFRTRSHLSAKSALIHIRAAIIARRIRICLPVCILPALIKSIVPVLSGLIIIRRVRQYVIVSLVSFHRLISFKHFVLGAERYALCSVGRVIAISETFFFRTAPARSALILKNCQKFFLSFVLFTLSFNAVFNLRDHFLRFGIILGYLFQFGQGFFGSFKTFSAYFKISEAFLALERIKTRFRFHNFVDFIIAVKFFSSLFRNKFFAGFRIDSALVKIYIFTSH